MLTDLTIKNFAIIDTLHVPFQPGLSILTGETGAGKSIIIDAVNLVLGGRASADLIRTGEEDAVVEALFDLSSFPGILSTLAETGIECDGELLVKRVVSRSGRNRVFINGGLSTIAALADIARLLINIYGQHESQTLLRPENHLALLDGYGRLEPLAGEFSLLYQEYRRVLGALKELEEGERDVERRQDMLSFQSDEIAGASLVAGEEEELLRERQLLAHGEKLLLHSQRAFELLYGGDASLLGQLQRVTGDVTEISAIDESLTGVLASLSESAYQLEDAALALRDYAAAVQADPERLGQVEDRLDLIGRLKKKYAPTIEEILDYKERIDHELQQLRNREQSREEMDRSLAELQNRLREKGGELSAGRRQAAAKLQEAMERQLNELAMKNAVFTVSFSTLAEPRSAGYEKAEFLFSPNPGEEPRQLVKIASGGELSRLMLALKQIHPESDVPTLVFDEVDTGIGGATSAVVGEKLKRVAAVQQVLCITHLPQVAAYADHHYRVEKRVDSGRTTTSVTPLQGEERVGEMARMLGGVKITETTLDHAREMIESARG
ncbi:DNA repair protein RecN [Geobacter sp. DSM 9736]|uniref:DNA repair protein RecN n=1 Tax=Geobacter sp. DSM 9736 TaxID=1277350 RepID=UPI000B5134AD|nr:DNA repair protein RecN [Geobacter sp. DSM 9736]SNB46214.1 DNA replication and repair protein RecN [Geobacter sp. DSM 9736]